MLNFQEPQQKQQSRTSSEQLLIQPKAKSKQKLSQMQIDRLLNQKRSKEYVEAMKRLDAGGHMHNQHQVDQLVQIIQKEMPEIEIDMGPIGIVSKCYLGDPYEVHTLDVAGNIIEHYESYRSMPSGMEKARSLAKSGFYAFIEVYSHALRAVKEDGTVATLKE
jgi:hypothetical protein